MTSCNYPGDIKKVAMPFISSVLSVADQSCGSYNKAEVCSWCCSVICGFCGPCVTSIAVWLPTASGHPNSPIFTPAACILWMPVAERWLMSSTPFFSIFVFLSLKVIRSLAKWKDGAIQG